MKNKKLEIGIGFGAVILALVYDAYMVKQYGKIIMKKEEQNKFLREANEELEKMLKEEQNKFLREANEELDKMLKKEQA